MTLENLVRGKEIEKEIGDINAHIKDMERVTNRGGDWDDRVILRISDGDRSSNLMGKHLPISCKDFIDLYKTKLECRKKELAKEFETL